MVSSKDSKWLTLSSTWTSFLFINLDRFLVVKTYPLLPKLIFYRIQVAKVHCLKQLSAIKSLIIVTHELFNIASSTHFCLHQNALLIFTFYVYNWKCHANIPHSIRYSWSTQGTFTTFKTWVTLINVNHYSHRQVSIVQYYVDCIYAKQHWPALIYCSMNAWFLVW